MTLPTPAFFRPEQVAEVYVERAALVAEAAAVYQRQHNILPAAQDRYKIAAFGIDRREYAESTWFMQASGRGTYLAQWFVEARGPGRKDHRLSLVLFSCGPAGRVAVRYVRGLASDEIDRSLTAVLSIGGKRTALSLMGRGTPQNTVEVGSLFSSGTGAVAFDEFALAAAADVINVVETDRFAETSHSRVIKLSTHGLAEGIKTLRARCGPTVSN